MFSSKRANYVFIKDFDYKMILPTSSRVINYKKGFLVNLRVNGDLAKEWLEKGYIKLSDDQRELIDNNVIKA